MGGKQTGFSLVELLTVMIIASIIFVFVGNIGSGRGLELQATRDDIVAGLFRAQQVAMARQGSSNSVQFISDGTSVDVQENGASIDIYPLLFPPGVSLTPTTLDYDKLGRTAGGLLTLNSSVGSIDIEVESSGYAH